MFKVADYEVIFKHYKDAKGPYCTLCEIVNPDKTLKSDAVAMCSPEDQFVRNTGRKIALGRALKAFTREERVLFWEAYFKARGNRW